MSYNPNSKGVSAKASRQLLTSYQNGAGGTISKGTPVSTNASGQLAILDVTNETYVEGMVGLAAEDIPNGAWGNVVSDGRLENFVSAFAIGDPIYVGLSGSLCNCRPAVGMDGFVHGDFVVFVGVLVVNEFNPLLTDIQLMLSVVGEL